MASPRSRLVTWSYTHLSFYGRRFWRPHPDLDRAATPALPPGGGRPLCGGWLPLLAAVSGCFAWAPQTTSPGAEPPEPPCSRACVGCEGRLALGATGGWSWVGRGVGLGATGGLPGCEGRLALGTTGGCCVDEPPSLRPFLRVSQVLFHRFKSLAILSFG